MIGKDRVGLRVRTIARASSHCCELFDRDQNLDLDQPFRHGKRFDLNPGTGADRPFLTKYLCARSEYT